MDSFEDLPGVIVCLPFGEGPFISATCDAGYRLVTLVFQEKRQAEGNPGWRRQQAEKRLSEKHRIRGRKLLKSCGLFPSWTSWPALCLFATRSSLPQQECLEPSSATSHTSLCENIPTTKIKVLCFDRPMILALTYPRFFGERASPCIDSCH